MSKGSLTAVILFLMVLITTSAFVIDDSRSSGDPQQWDGGTHGFLLNNGDISHPSDEGWIALGNSNFVYELTENYDSNGKYYLTENIDMDSVFFEPIGYDSGTGAIAPFEGIFDGNGYIITGLGIRVNNQSNDDAYAGLFAQTDGATITNLGLEDGSITAISSEGDAYAGSIAGSSLDTVIRNCYSDLLVTSSGLTVYIGGLVGDSDDITISYSFSANAVTSSSDAKVYAGGLVGLSTNASVAMSYNVGAVTTSSPDSEIGGLIGHADSADIKNAFNSGSVRSHGDYADAGGLIGSSGSAGVTNSYNTGSIRTTFNSSYKGGLIGSATTADIINSYYLYQDALVIVGNGTVSSPTYDSSGSRDDTELKGLYSQEGTFTNWNISTLWTIDTTGTINSGYPYLKQQEQWENFIVKDDGHETTAGSTGLNNANFISQFITGYSASASYHLEENIDLTWLKAAGAFDVYLLVDTSGSDVIISLYYYNDGTLTLVPITDLTFYINGKAYTPSGTDATVTISPSSDGNYSITAYEKTSFTNTILAISVFVSSYDINNNEYRCTMPSKGGYESPAKASASAFKGTFDGNGYTISGTYSASAPTSSISYSGLIAYAVNNAKIINIGLEGGSGFAITSSNYRAYTGGLVGYANNAVIITNSYNTGSMYSYSYSPQTGGLIGYVDGTLNLTNSYNTGSISSTVNFSTADSNAGGLVGLAIEANITNSYNMGSVYSFSSTYAPNSHAGGLIGYAHIMARIINSYNTGPVSAISIAHATAGGLIGWAYTDADITNSYNTGSVSAISSFNDNLAYSYAGGLVGHLYETVTITNSYNIGVVSTTYSSPAVSYIGGLVGTATIAEIINSYYLYQGALVIVGNGTISSPEYDSSGYRDDTELKDLYSQNGTFTNWNISTLWTVDAAKNGGYPYLKQLEQWENFTVKDEGHETAVGSIGLNNSNFISEFVNNYQSSASYHLEENIDLTWYRGTVESFDIYLLVDTSGQNTVISLHYYNSVTLTPVPVTSSTDITFHVNGKSYSSSAMIATVTNVDKAPDGNYSISVYGTTSLAGLTKDTIAISAYISSEDLTTGEYRCTMPSVGGYANPSTSLDPFIGTFDGNGYTISGMYSAGISTSSDAYSGLIAYAGNDAKIINLGLEGGSSFAHSNLIAYAGGLISYAYKTNITNSYNTGSVSSSPSSSSPSHAGGLIGYAYETNITNSYNTGSVSSSSSSSPPSHAGGLISYAYKTNITNSYNTGSVSSSSSSHPSYAGGLIGQASETNITNSYNTASVSSSSSSSFSYAGGFIGYAYETNITNSYNTGSVSSSSSSSPSYAGGLIGYAYETNITNSYNTASVSSSSSSSSSYAGGLIGYATTAEIINSYHLYQGALGIIGSGTVSSPEYDSSGSRDDTELKDLYSQNGTFTNWNISTLWTVDTTETINNGYPYLKQQEQWENFTVKDEGHETAAGSIGLNNSNFISEFVGNYQSSASYHLEENIDLTRLKATGAFDVYLLVEKTGVDEVKISLQYYDNGTLNPVLITNLDFYINGETYTPSGTDATVTIPESSDGNYSISVYGTTSLVGLTNDTIAISAYVSSEDLTTGTYRCTMPSQGGYVSPATSSKAFTGTFDGNGYTISGMYSADVQSSIAYSGLIAYAGDGAKIINLGIEGGSSFAYSSDNYAYAGGLIGYTGSSDIINSYSGGSISATSISSNSYAGGLIGYAHPAAHIITSYNTGSIFASTYAGGLIGHAYAEAHIITSYNTGAISASTYAGGLIGHAYAEAHIITSYNTGAISATSISSNSYAGGLIGYTGTAANITNSYNTGFVSSNSYAGGLIGYTGTAAIVTTSYNTGAISATSISSNSYAGGLIGYTSVETKIINSYNMGLTSSSSNADSYAGGLIGYAGTAAIVTNSYNTGSISATSNSYAGGLIGYANSTATITNSYYLDMSVNIATDNLVGNKSDSEVIAGTGDTSGSRFEEQMKNGPNSTGGQETYKDWKFESQTGSVWAVDTYSSSSPINNGYPYLPATGGYQYKMMTAVYENGITSTPSMELSAVRVSPGSDVTAEFYGEILDVIINGVSKGEIYDHTFSIISGHQSILILAKISVDITVASSGLPSDIDPDIDGKTGQSGSMGPITPVSWVYTVKIGDDLVLTAVEVTVGSDTYKAAMWVADDGTVFYGNVLTLSILPVDSDGTYTVIYLNTTAGSEEAVIYLTSNLAVQPTFKVDQLGQLMPIQDTSDHFVVKIGSPFNITAPTVTDYTFQQWIGLTVENPATIAAGTLTVGPLTTYTAEYILEETAVLVTLKADPDILDTSGFAFSTDGETTWANGTAMYVTSGTAFSISAPMIISVYTFQEWKDIATINVAMISGVTEATTYTAKYEPPPKYYTITATADPGATVSPEGQISVLRGNSQTFRFAPVERYVISAVIVDGVHLTEQQIALGYYTFTNVMMNHTITVHNTRAEIILNVEVAEGKGYVEYKINNGSFTRYTSTVSLPENATVTIRAYADNDYQFKEYIVGSIVYKNSEVSFENVMSSLYVQVYFEDAEPVNPSDNMWLWIVAGILLLLLAGFLIWFIFFYRRSYEVVKIESAAGIEGKDKARRKRAYSFNVNGSVGTVAYRVGEEGSWKTITPNADGSYTIPREDVIDKIMIETR